jgi:hypothetical protein
MCHYPLQARLATAEQSREQAIASHAGQVALLQRDLETEKGKAQEVIQDNGRMASEITALKVLIEEREGRIRVLEADAR